MNGRGARGRTVPAEQHPLPWEDDPAWHGSPLKPTPPPRRDVRKTGRAKPGRRVTAPGLMSARTRLKPMSEMTDEEVAALIHRVAARFRRKVA